MIRFIKRFFLIVKMSLLRLTHNMYWAVDLYRDPEDSSKLLIEKYDGLRLVRDEDVAHWDNGMPVKYLKNKVITAHPSILEEFKYKEVFGDVFSDTVGEAWVFIPKSHWTQKKDRHNTLECACSKCSAVQLELRQQLGRACGASVSSVVEAGQA